MKLVDGAAPTAAGGRVRESIGRGRAAALVLLAALGAYANSLGNGFALDDNWFIVENEVVTEGRYGEAFTRASWPEAREGTGNYRPLVLSSFALEWSLWQDAPLGYHVLNVVAHAVVSLLVLLLLGTLVTTGPALAGALLFAVHPVHVEAVANVMGRSELYAAIGYLGACLLHLRPVGDGAWARGGRLLGVLALYTVALGSKEIAVTLPATLIALDLYRSAEGEWRARLRREALTYAALFAALGCYVLIRWNAVGDVTGRGAAAGLFSLDTPSRILSALTVWPEYLRLLVFPADLIADYGPAVLLPTTSVTLDVVLGSLLLAGAVVGALGLRRGHSTAALGLAWFVITISPVSNLFVRADVLLAERILYLPSVAASFIVAALAVSVLATERVALRRGALALAAVCGALLLGRTVVRNPTWMDTYSLLSTLARDHPESWAAQRGLAVGFQGVGDRAAAMRAYEAALELAPDHYQVLVEAAVVFDEVGRVQEAEALFERAVRLIPDRPHAYGLLAERRLLRGEGRAAHAAAARGIANATAVDRNLWALLSESYVMKGDLEAAVRARRASLGVEETAAGWTRLAELFEELELMNEARRARAKADHMKRSSTAGRG